MVERDGGVQKEKTAAENGFECCVDFLDKFESLGCDRDFVAATMCMWMRGVLESSEGNEMRDRYYNLLGRSDFNRYVVNGDFFKDLSKSLGHGQNVVSELDKMKKRFVFTFETFDFLFRESTDSLDRQMFIDEMDQHLKAGNE